MEDPFGHSRLILRSCVTDPPTTLISASAWPFITGSRRVIVAAKSMTSPTCRPSGWITPESAPLSDARSRLFSRRSTVNVCPEASTSMTFPPRIRWSLWTVTVSTSGLQVAISVPAAVSPSGFSTSIRISE